MLFCLCLICRTMVAITSKQRLMGTSARNQAVTNFKNTLWGFTPFLGRKFSDPVVQEEIKRVPYQVVERPGGDIGIKVSKVLCWRNSIIKSYRTIVTYMRLELAGFI